MKEHAPSACRHTASHAAAPVARAPIAQPIAQLGCWQALVDGVSGQQWPARWHWAAQAVVLIGAEACAAASCAAPWVRDTAAARRRRRAAGWYRDVGAIELRGAGKEVQRRRYLWASGQVGRYNIELGRVDR